VPTFSYSSERPTGRRVDLLVLPVFEGPAEGPGVNDVKGLDLLGLYEASGAKGKRGEFLIVPNTGVEGLEAKAVLLVGVGSRDEADADACRRAIGRVASKLSKRRSIATTLPQIVRGRLAEDAIQATVEGLVLGTHRFDRYKSSNDGRGSTLREVEILGAARTDARAARAAIDRGEVIAESQAWARDLVNTPALDLPPAELAREAQKMAKQVGLTSKIWTESELEKGGFGGILGVGQGSVRPPRLIELRYDGGRGAPIAFTGKGIAFDSGGLSIKDSTGMEHMKIDMGGAASILGTMRALALLKPKIDVIAAIPSSENMPSGSAIRPGDVLRHRGGKTSEVLNTDAEGRLVLADALAYLAEQKPRAIIDTATLTGACMVALGEDLWGAMGNDRQLMRDVLAAGEAAGEPGWELPMYEPYRRMIDSDVADIKNVGKRWGGAITAAMFLREFVDGIPWVHIDIAGPAFSERVGDYWPKGATGTPVRALVRYVLSQAGARRR
jgi:leucyl aminopeptidase